MALDRLLHKTLGHPESDTEENKWLLSEQERAAINDDSSYKWPHHKENVHLSEVKLLMHHNEANEYDGDEDSDAGDGDYANNHFQHEEILRRNTEEDWKKKEAKRKLMTASIICTIFLAAEVIGGLMSHSIAILSDASHVFADMSSFILSLIAIHFSSKNPTRSYNFGYSRLEVIIAVVNVIFIWALTAALVVEAIARVRKPDEFELNGKIMLLVSSLAVLFNLTLGMMLHGEHGHSHGGHTHSHGGGHSHAKSRSQEDKQPKSRHSHHDDLEQADRNHAGDLGCASPASKRSAFSLSSIAESANNADINVRAAMIHVIGDLLQSIGVFIASVLIYVNPEWKIADPICTFLFSVLVLCTTLPLLRDALRILMMAAPVHIDHEKVSTALLEVKGVLMVHDLKIWTLSNSKVFCSCHLATESSVNHTKVLYKSNMILKRRFDISESTVQIETFTKQMLTCKICKLFD